MLVSEKFDKIASVLYLVCTEKNRRYGLDNTSLTKLRLKSIMNFSLTKVGMKNIAFRLQVEN